MGLDASVMESSGHLYWIQGDDALHAVVQRIKKYLSAHSLDYHSFGTHFSLLETWHIWATSLNSIA
jgi:hypothetical protein